MNKQQEKIKVQEAIKILTSEIYSDEIAECGVKFKEALDMVIKALEQKPQTGHWIDINTEQEWYDEEFVCSECKGHMLGTTEFCPYCGARMESENKE